jgi:hypothetical protein
MDGGKLKTMASIDSGWENSTVCKTDSLAEEEEVAVINHPKSSAFWTKRNAVGRLGVLCCALTATIVFILNLSMTIYIVKTQRLNKQGRFILFDGVCKKTKTYSLIIHLLINAVSTALLAASNYCMQYVVAPTREDIDRAHKERDWVEIGVHSVRNLKFICWRRKAIWISLALSSLPLHLLYVTNHSPCGPILIKH